jgi:hypothetical protein
MCSMSVHYIIQKHCMAGRDRTEFTPPKTTQYTVKSTFSLNYKVQPQCNGNKKFSLKMTQQGRNM